MSKIKGDFLRGELSRLALCAAGFAVCLLVLLRFWPRGRDLLPQLTAGIAAILVLAALRAAVQVHISMRSLNDGDICLLEREYAAPHPVYRVWQGEIHLLPGIIVCRSRGRLLFLPVDRIERVEERTDRVGLQRVPFAKFVMDTGQAVSIGFSPRHPEDSGPVFAWLAGRTGQK